ncbi:hypothetical protein R1flu_004680 [Riccia fluitans]|uniref:Uncharacterized protein n=1 Tax=Riccia fluitans TaxID=41844 RepID=A0ABD1YRJ3_9MARC
MLASFAGIVSMGSHRLKVQYGAKLDFKELPADDVFHSSYRSTQAGDCWTNVQCVKDNVLPTDPRLLPEEGVEGLVQVASV